MCVSVYINDERIGTLGELARAIGRENIVYGGESQDEFDPIHCLCGINADKTAEKIGMVSVDDGWGDLIFKTVIHAK